MSVFYFRYSKSVRTTVLYLFTIQLLLYSAAFSDSHNSTNTPSGAEFLQNVIGNLQRPKHKIRVAHERIDVEEYIPNDVPYNAHGDEFKILSKHPYNYNVQNVLEYLFFTRCFYQCIYLC